MSIQIEDNATDVLRKSMLGRGISSEMISEKTGISLSEIRRLRKHRASGETRSKIAVTLGLSPEKLELLDLKFDSAVSGNFTEEAKFPRNFRREIMFCGNKVLPKMTSNAYVVTDETCGNALVVDCGKDAGTLVEVLRSRAVRHVDLCITHNHFDHAGGINELRDAFPSMCIYNFNTLFLGTAGNTVDFDAGNFALRAISVPGHTTDSVVYLWKNPSTGFAPIAFTGDTLFLGSVGGCLPGDLEQSLGNIKARLLDSLSEETVVAPGHGPATGIGTEILENPFF